MSDVRKPLHLKARAFESRIREEMLFWRRWFFLGRESAAKGVYQLCTLKRFAKATICMCFVACMTASRAQVGLAWSNSWALKSICISVRLKSWGFDTRPLPKPEKTAKSSAERGRNLPASPHRCRPMFQSGQVCPLDVFLHDRKRKRALNPIPQSAKTAGKRFYQFRVCFI